MTVQAVSGNHAVFFGFDLSEEARPGCLGFAVHRTDHTENEQYWLAGFKTFKSVVPLPDPNTIYSARDHPMQTFYWGDYTAKPAHDYTYRVVPRYGDPKNLVDRTGVDASVDVSTSDPAQGTHGVYFNRGVAASQAYARRFGLAPDELPADKRKDALAWLSRGLAEAIVGFIGQASSSDFALRAAVYEFTQPDVLRAFDNAHWQGADVKVVYHARDDSEGDRNRSAIARAELDHEMLIKRTNANIAHNKFIVLCTKDGAGELTPVSVWTGSTNFSEGGIYGHSNVGHAVRDADVAREYLAFWSELATDPKLDALRDWSSTNSPFDPHAAVPNGVRTVFSPRHGLAPLAWYADQFGAPAKSAFITLAFGMTSALENALRAHGEDALHYVMLDKPDNHQDDWAVTPKVLVAVGAAGGPSALSRWAEEQLTGFNSFVPYLHTKVLLSDPLSATPTVVSGSANYSPNSTNVNDENMLVITGAPEVADVYFTEFARIFNHFYARYWAARLLTAGSDADSRAFLDETDAWQTPYFTGGGPKRLQRILYSTQVEGNAPA